MTTAAQRLATKIKTLRAPVCVGLDPTPEQMPNAAMDFFTWGKQIIDAVADIVPAVKPQSAMYERFGTDGVKIYHRIIAYAKSKGLIVIGDVKRGDIGSTALAYADGHLSEEGADFITVNPYLGRDSAEPFIEAAKTKGKGLFILVRTSNPGGADLQNLTLENGKKLYEHVGELVVGWGKGCDSIGAVVGATAPSEAKALRAIMPDTFFLIPGYGAQGGTAADCALCFDARGGGGIVNSSRGITGAWKKHGKPEKFAEYAREEAIKMIEDLRGHVNT